MIRHSNHMPRLIALTVTLLSLLTFFQCSPTPAPQEKPAESSAKEDSSKDASAGEKEKEEPPSVPDPDAPSTADATEPSSQSEEPAQSPDRPDKSDPDDIPESDDPAPPEGNEQGLPESSEPSPPETNPEQAPPKVGCAVSPTTAWKPLQASTYKVGKYSIEVASNNILQIFHSTAAKKVVFQASQQSPIVAQQVDLKVEEHQGSFDIKDKLKKECKQSRLKQVAFDGKSLHIQGTFDDCQNVAFHWSFCEAQTEHLRFVLKSTDTSYNTMVMRLKSKKDQRLYGMGMQHLHDSLNLKGKKVPALVQEGGVGRGHKPISPAVNRVSKGSAGSEVSNYYTMPHFMTDQWNSFLLENTELSIFDFTADDTLSVRLFASSMRGRIIFATSPLLAIERLTEYTGRMPALPDWVNQGAIVALARSLKESEKHINALLAKGAKIAGIWNQTWSGKVKTFIGEQVLWNWAYNPNYHPDWSKFVANLKKKNIKVLCYINSMFAVVPKEAGKVSRKLFDEGKAKGYFVKNAKGANYLIKVTAFEVGLLDLTNPAARTWMKKIIKDEMIKKAGCSGWMADFAEALPFDAVLHSKVSASQYHNQYPVDWIKLNREALDESGNLGKILVFNRSGFTTSPKYSMLLWQGDQLTTWDKYDGLVSALHGLINGGLSGISLNHSDTGGYTSLSYLGLGYDREKELLKRWTEMNAFTAVLRTHEGNQPGLNAQVYSDSAAMEHFARMTKVYAALAFYRKTLFKEAQSKGWPVVRHLMLHYPNDSESQKVDDQFLLGSEFLVAPIKNKCWTKPLCSYNKEVYLPPGRWVHLWTGKVFGNKTKGVRVKVKAPIGKPAVFYKEGSSAGKTFVQNLKKSSISGLP